MPRNGLARPYPPGFTHLIAEVADTAMKAVVEPDPRAYVERRTSAERLDLVRFRRALATDDRRDPKVRSAFRHDIARTKVVRELALETLGAFQWLERLRQHGDRPASASPLPGADRRSFLTPSRQGSPRPTVAESR